MVGIGQVPFKELLSSAPLSSQAREQIAQIQEAKIDYSPGLSSAEKKQRLSRISYEAFLRNVVHAEPAVLRFYHARTMGEWGGVGTDAVSALDCWGFGLPEFQGLSLAKGSISRMGYTPAGYENTGGSLRLHFHDGNATIARLLVRDLLPAGAGKQRRGCHSVALRNWHAFQKLGVHQVYAPGSYHTGLRLNPHVNIGDCRTHGTVDDEL